MAVTRVERGMPRIAAADPMAQRAGLTPGMPLADARALAPTLRTVNDDHQGLRRDLERLADWARCYTPWVSLDDSAPDGNCVPHGLWLDVGGSAHLFGGEQALLEDLRKRLAGFGLTARLGLAETPGAAWAAARFGATSLTLVTTGRLRAFLAPLPLAALRLPPATLDALERMGPRRIEDLLTLPRAPLTRRFGDLPGRRLDQALGGLGDPISPRAEVEPPRVRRSFVEPIGRAEDVEAALSALLAELCERLAKEDQGVRKLIFRLYRVDGSALSVTIGTRQPVRDPEPLFRLFRDTGKLDGLDSGFGIEAVTLDAELTDPLNAQQTDHQDRADTRRDGGLAHLLDRLTLRLGPGRVVRLSPYPSHWPERASRAVAPHLSRRKENAMPHSSSAARRVAGLPGHAPLPPRPLHLLPQPEPIEAVASLPDDPPALIRRRGRIHRIARTEGPERIAPEWWRRDSLDHPAAGLARRTRDYYRVEDQEGRRFWVYREGLMRPGVPPKWYLHGEFQ
ncbi:Protein ImuB [Magnetospira sp. QH-2]|nr:Protein ImuB [Magnetospira sp. QH-2]